ncbi:MAG: DUF5131 family protein [Thermoproteota archaeon]
MSPLAGAVDQKMGPLVKMVSRFSRREKYPRGRVILPPNWVGKRVIIALEDLYIILEKKEYEHMRKAFINLTILMRLFEDILNNSNGSRMFSVVSKTWNPVTGCLHACRFCWARRLAETKLKNYRRYRQGFVPRFNGEEFRIKFEEGDFVFVSDMGDLFGNFIPKDWILRVLNHVKKFPKTYFLFLTKNPSRYADFIEHFPDNVILGTTIETNKDDLYLEHKISNAPIPSLRYEGFKKLEWEKKFVSIEPILDFDAKVFSEWIKEIEPIMVYVGYDNYNNCLPEPPLAKTLKLIETLREKMLVIKKNLRPAWYESIKTEFQERHAQ